jgi:hypothetical protein
MELYLEGLKLKQFLEGKHPAPPTDNIDVSTHNDSLQIINIAKI